MNIDDYIKITKRNLYKLKPEFNEDKNILELLSMLASNIDSSILIKTIFSTEIFPSIVRINESSYLLWDMHFWKIFEELFKTNYLFFVDDIKKQCLTNEKVVAHTTMIYRYYFLDILTCRLENQYLLSYRLAQEEFFVRELIKRFPDYQLNYNYSKKTSDEIYDSILFSKIFVMLHEVHHCYFKKDKKFYLTCIEYFQTVADVFLNDIDLINISMDKDIIKILRKRSYKNVNNIEESICDFHAFKLAYEFLIKEYHDLSKNEIIERLYCGFCSVIQIVCTVQSCITLWKEGGIQFEQYYKNYKMNVSDLYSKINQYIERMHNRVSLLKVLIAVDLHKLDIPMKTFEKGDRISQLISEYSKEFFDIKYLAAIFHDSMNLKVANESKNFILDSINLLTGALYE